MTSVAQIQANRLNAQKSTGPRTAAGKERASGNALKHGLLAREAVIQGEDPEEFELYREGMLEELAPAGTVETMLAERVVGLSWRLRRAERLQNAAFAALDDGEPTPLLEARHEEWKQLKANEWERGVAGLFDEDAALGKVVVEDFGGARVLDRLLMYERRIESSLYRTMAQLRQERQARTAAAEPEEDPCSEGGPPAGQESAMPAKLGSFDLGATPKRSLSVSSPAQESPPSRHGQTSLSVPPTRVDRFPHTLSRSQGPLPVEQESAAPAELASFGADTAAGDQTRETACENPVRRGMGLGSPLGAERPSGAGQNSALGVPCQPVNHRQDGDPKRDSSRLGTHADATKAHGQDARATIPSFQARSGCAGGGTVVRNEPDFSGTAVRTG